jgi:hypothetical protein
VLARQDGALEQSEPVFLKFLFARLSIVIDHGLGGVDLVPELELDIVL